jgi:hypothetical protein
MTSVVHDRELVLEATQDDLREAVNAALKRADCTFGQLAKQAKTGDFDSMRALLAWVAVGDLGDLAER